jgi:HK97 family phage major capsid protein
MPEPTIDDVIDLHQRIVDKAKEAKARAHGTPGFYGSGGGTPGFYGAPDESPGAVFARSAQVKTWLSRFPGGGPNSEGTYQSDPVLLKGGLRALITSADASAGSWVRPDYRGLLEPGAVRPLVLRQLVSVIPTTSDLVQWVREVARVAAAAPTAEATALTGTSGTKPEGGVTFELLDVPVRTFPVWIPATKRIVADATGLRAYVDQLLREDVAEEMEDQMLAGSGTGENFRGILNDPGIQTAGPPGAGEGPLHVIRTAVRLVATGARTKATAVLLNPADAEDIDLLEVNNEPNHFLGDPFNGGPGTLWRVPRVESTAVPAGTALVGDFRKAVLFDREETTISVGTAGDDFIRNIVRVLAEARAAFTVTRPAAFVAVDLAA